MRLFVTGFGPFGNIADNPSGWIAENLGLPHALIPVSWSAADEFIQNFPQDRFDALLLMGVAASRTELTPELFAWNIIGPNPDVDGIARPGLIDSDGPDRLPASLWTADQVADWDATGVTSFSLHPGTYLCNYIFYRALQRLPSVRVGFLHVPGDDHMDRETQLARVQTIIGSL